MGELTEAGDVLSHEDVRPLVRVLAGLLLVMSLALGIMMLVLPAARHQSSGTIAPLAAIGVVMLLLAYVFARVPWRERVEIDRATQALVRSGTCVLPLWTRREEVSIAGLERVGVTYRTGAGLRQATSWWYVDLMMPANGRITVVRLPRDPSATTPPAAVRAEAKRLADFLRTTHEHDHA